MHDDARRACGGRFDADLCLARLHAYGSEDVYKRQVVMYAISAALSYALTRLMIVISRRVVNTMRHDVFQKLSELPKEPS